MARYRKVETQTWLDAAFQSFTAPQPNGQTLWLYLLCGPRTTIFPGLIVAREEVMASDLRWKLESFRKAFAEVSANLRVRADWKAGIVVLTRALFDRHGDIRESAKPGNPNILKNWAREWDQVPECSLKDEYLFTLKSLCDAMTESFAEAFDKALGKALAKASSNQEQQQEQQQEQKDLPYTPLVESSDLTLFKAKVDRIAATKRAAADRREIAERVLGKLSERSGVAYRSEAHVALVMRHLEAGITEDDLRRIVAYCSEELGWQADPRMKTYLRPKTLFGPQKIFDYLDPAREYRKDEIIAPSTEIAHG